MKIQCFLLPALLVLLLGCSQQPRTLSGKMEKIEVSYVNWACDCANFIETKYYYSNNPDAALAIEKNCFYIEPAHDSLKIPEKYYNEDHFLYTLILTGQFYEDEGVPDSYERKTPEKAEKGRVFRYDEVKMVRK